MDREQLLRDPDIYPSDSVIADALGDSYSAYKSFVGSLPDKKIDIEWRYYNDGKSWLGKAVAKKKTVFWLSVWDGYFLITMYFTEKTRDGVLQLPVDGAIKESLISVKMIGKLVPLILEISDSSQLKDAETIIAYKQSIK